MAFFTLGELIDVIIMTIAVGFIFSGSFKRPEEEDYEPLKQSYGRFNWQNIWFAVIITAPAVIFHELFHKIVALYFDLNATFHAAYFWLGIGIILKLINFGFIFFVPGYVSIGCASMPCTFTPLMSSIIAFSGPFLNLVLWLGSLALLKFNPGFIRTRKTFAIIHLTKSINMFLFIFNMIPIPGFDGFKVFEGLIQAFF
ncbi:M50 family metallopeptidase [Candidatus Woesearchaeota archaeon]|nr:M50 family metallopeptidase [Candidatus Woesearchaeota archaeon]